MSKIDLLEMSRDELIELQGNIKTRLKDFRPYRIKERVIQCGKQGCWCCDGPDGHGPYLFVTYRRADRTRQVGLGPKLTATEMVDAIPDEPELVDYLKIPDHRFQKMARGATVGWKCYTLSDREFFDRHGVYPQDDTFSRTKTFWGSSDDYDAYDRARRWTLLCSSIQYNEWAAWGVSTLKGVEILRDLEKKGYYLKT